MTDLAPDVDALPAPARSDGAEAAWAAYADLLGLLRGTIHLDGPADPVDAAIERLFAIAEAWAAAAEPGSDDALPYSRRSEVDLVSTLLAVASYSPGGRDFRRLAEAFVEAVESIPSRPRMNFASVS
jgi:hypothetical protein